jgi:hypothetical protein
MRRAPFRERTSTQLREEAHLRRREAQSAPTPALAEGLRRLAERYEALAALKEDAIICHADAPTGQ